MQALRHARDARIRGEPTARREGIDCCKTASFVSSRDLQNRRSNKLFYPDPLMRSAAAPRTDRGHKPKAQSACPDEYPRQQAFIRPRRNTPFFRKRTSFAHSATETDQSSHAHGM